MAKRPDAATVERVDTSVFRVPTDFPESDGTLAWSETVMVAVEVRAGGERGLGYTYADRATAVAVVEHLAPLVVGREAADVGGAWRTMVASLRNVGASGIGAMALSAVDVGLWDLRARLLGVPVARLLGAVREEIPAYGSGGFTSYPAERLQAQLGGWAAAGLRMVKMKVGRDPAADLVRVRAAREAIGEEVELFVDANGAYGREEALARASELAALGVTWLEEPVSSDDVEGLRLLRDAAPAPLRIAAGEYGYRLDDFRRLLEAGAVDVLQADATRCGGFTGFLRAAALAEAFHVPLSSHTAPSLHAHVMCAAPTGCHAEYFHDHVRVEGLLLDGALRAREGALRPDPRRPGLGLTLRSEEATRFAA